VINKPDTGNVHKTSGLWDAEIDGSTPKSSYECPISVIPARVWIAVGAGGCLVPLLFLAAILFLARGTPQDRDFHENLYAVNQRAQKLGGGVSNGRRAFRYHVGAWFHGKEITDRDMPEIVTIIRDCQSRGLGGAHLGLDISRSSIGDNGIKHLHSVQGLETVSIRDTNVTKDGVELLRKALPRTHVDAWPIYPAGSNQIGAQREISVTPLGSQPPHAGHERRSHARLGLDRVSRFRRGLTANNRDLARQRVRRIVRNDGDRRGKLRCTSGESPAAMKLETPTRAIRQALPGCRAGGRMPSSELGKRLGRERQIHHQEPEVVSRAERV
jgi:hypothetical protein